MKNLVSPLFAVVLCLSMVAGCTSKKAIVGKWKSSDGDQVEFTEDGKVIVGNSASGIFTLSDNSHFNVQMNGDKLSTVAYEVNGDTLSTTDENGKKEALTRVK